MKYIVLFFLIPVLSCANSENIKENKVLPGAYRLSSYLPLLKGKSIGIVANPSSEVNGVHIVDTLLSLGMSDTIQIQINKVFSPEHGFSGQFEAGKSIEDEGHISDTIEIVSLYGKNFKPIATDLEGIDIMLFDLQDVGVRFYTYISTLHYVMQACAEKNIPLIVLDRPNPHIHYCDGPVLEEKYKSFVGMHQVPIVYGMTIGEYAKMINGEGWLGNDLQCELFVIEVENYNRKSIYDFPVKPSPNLPNMQSILLYPSLCLFEGTIMSVGRGTSLPFQVVGHPNFSDKTFSFTPASVPGASVFPKYENEKCYGINFSTIPIDSLRKVSKIQLNYLLDIYNNMTDKDDFFIDYFNLLAGNNVLQHQISDGLIEKEIRDSWEPGLKAFKEIREKYLIYQ